MFHILGVLIASAFIVGGTAAQAQVRTDPAAQTPAHVLVTAAPDAEGLILRYKLPAPVTRFVFADDEILRDRWTVVTSGLSFVDGEISSDRAFDAFELHLKPDAAEVDRVYPGLSRIGDGWVVYGPGLVAKDQSTTLAFDLASQDLALPAANPIGGYVYVGPRARVEAAPAGDVALGANVDPALSGPLRRTFFNAMTFYEQQLGAPLRYRPAMFVSVDSPGPTTFRGDVTDTGAISLRFHGDGWRETGDQLSTFVWHEAFHLWNGHGVENRDSQTAPWLHEGGADYAAVVGAVTAGDLTEAEGRAALSRRVNGCRNTLGDRDMNPARLRSGSGPYSCGVLIQWLADLELRRQGSSVFGLWKSVLAGARDGSNGYGVAEFRARLAADSAVNVLLDSPGADRWQAIERRLSALGVTITDRPGDQDLRAAALFHVADRNCKGSYGYNDTPGALTLDGAECGVLSGQPVIDTVEGFDPQKASRAMFEAVQARCAAGVPVRYRTRDGRLLEAVCDRPLETPVVWFVSEAPPLAI
jgi:hypothetical protein